MAVSKDKDRAAQPDPLGGDRGRGQDGDRLEVGRVGLERELSARIAAGRRPWKDHVIAYPERSDVARLSRPAEFQQRRARGKRTLGRKVTANLHMRLPGASSQL